MKVLFGTFSCCLLFACSGPFVFAPHTTVPFRQIEKSGPFSASLSVLEPTSMTGGSSSSASDPELTVAASYMRPSYKRERVVDSKFLLVNGLHIGLAALDIGLTQRCIASGHCREGNPMMPSSLAGQAAVGSAIVGYGFFVSYRLKKHDSKVWWLSPLVGIGAHSAGAVTGFINR